MSEEGFHEIQLSGKQLVFLFMATTVVSVVIFLLGVVVGRRVPAETLIADATGTSLEALAVDTIPAPGGETAADVPPAAGEAPPPVPEEADEFSYHERLQQAAPDPVEEPAAAEAEPESEEPAAEPEPPPAASGWVVQIGAYKDRATADRIVATLKRQRFPAFVLAPTAGSPTATFRVRVGPYNERREAETIAGRLQREHQYNPFVTR